MYYGKLDTCDMTNGSGVRVTLFVSGCRNHCKGCFQPQTWAFDFGKPFTFETEKEIFLALKPTYIDGLTLLGGDPFEPENQKALLPLLRKIRQKFPDKTIWCYTGCHLEDLLTPGCRNHCPETGELLSYIDILVDGPFIEAEKDRSLLFRGSKNQRLIDLNETRNTGRITLWSGFTY